jgi:hypothetical protein
VPLSPSPQKLEEVGQSGMIVADSRGELIAAILNPDGTRNVFDWFSGAPMGPLSTESFGYGFAFALAIAAVRFVFVS